MSNPSVTKALRNWPFFWVILTMLMLAVTNDDMFFKKVFKNAHADVRIGLGLVISDRVRG